jgi:hypothetical protein
MLSDLKTLSLSSALMLAMLSLSMAKSLPSQVRCKSLEEIKVKSHKNGKASFETDLIKLL